MAPHLEQNRTAHPRAPGLRLRRALPLAGPPHARLYGVESSSCNSRHLAARLRLRYVKKNTELTMTGPYAFTRNPLYLGSMLIAFGFALASRNIWIALALAVLFAVIYVPVIRSEEAFLRSKFNEFDDYAARVPRLLPRLIPASSPESERGSFSSGSVSKTPRVQCTDRCGGHLCRACAANLFLGLSAAASRTVSIGFDLASTLALHF